MTATDAIRVQTTSPQWATAMFAMLSPDAVVRGLLPQIVDRLAGHGFEPVAFCVITPSGPEVDAMTQGQVAGRGEAFRMRALDALFRLGPSLALALADRGSPPEQPRYADANQLKGVAPPKPGTPGTIRHDWAALNTVLSLIHISDSAEHSEHEAGLLTGGRTWLPAGQLPAALRLLSPVVSERRGYREVVAGVHSRLLMLAHEVLRDTEAVRWPSHLSEQATADEVLAAVRIAVESAHVPRADPVARAVLRILRHRFTAGETPVDITAVDELLRFFGSRLDAWESAVLETSQYFHPSTT
jgi:nucleoside diphosphate kinase